MRFVYDLYVFFETRLLYTSFDATRSVKVRWNGEERTAMRKTRLFCSFTFSFARGDTVLEETQTRVILARLQLLIFLRVVERSRVLLFFSTVDISKLKNEEFFGSYRNISIAIQRWTTFDSSSFFYSLIACFLTPRNSIWIFD